ncbi:MAG: biopolymer transporter ExbD [Planctomycetota bacterium]
MAAAGVGSGDSISVNLIAAADVVFQLLLFLMLTTDISQRELERSATFEHPSVKTYIEEEEENPDVKKNITTSITITHINEMCDKNYYRCQNKHSAEYDPFYNNGICENPEHWIKKHGGERINSKDELKKILKTIAKFGKASGTVSENAIVINADKRTPYSFIAELLSSIAAARIYKVKVVVEKKSR